VTAVAYELPPIDHWMGTTWFIPEQEAERAGAPAPPGLFPPDDDPHGLAIELTQLHRLAAPAFRTLGWEGDGGWRYGSFPDELNTRLWIAVKQSNNGTTYVLSPIAMPWLKDLAFTSIEVE
jgi:hypothetical protein